MKTIEELSTLNPCSEGLAWARQQPSLYQAWETCEKSEWMWWLLRRLNKCPKELSIKYAQGCADRVKQLKSNYAADAYATNAAAAHAAAAAADAAADAVTYAAADAADAYATDAAAAAAAAAADAVTYAADAAAYAACDAAYAAERKWQSDFLRTLVSNPFEKE